LHRTVVFFIVDTVL